MVHGRLTARHHRHRARNALADIAARRGANSSRNARSAGSSASRKFRAGYDIKVLLGELLCRRNSGRRNRGQLVRSPVELIVGTLRQFDLPQPDNRILALLGRGLGQEPFNPPNVKGWPGGTAWINANTLLIRQQLLRRLMAGEVRGAERQTAEGEMQEQPPAMREEQRARRQRALERGMARRLEGVDLEPGTPSSTGTAVPAARFLVAVKPVNPPRPTWRPTLIAISCSIRVPAQ
jgi:hypothetical protein